MRAPRLYLEHALAPAAEISLTRDRAHYLRNVMRLRTGDSLKVFNERDGEWRAELTGLDRRDVLLRLVERTRKPVIEDGPELYFAPLKRPRLEMLIEKAVELGARRLQPVVTAHTVVERLNPGRLRARIIEAAEQCERLTLPVMGEPIELAALPSDRPIVMADEHGGGLPLLQALDSQPDAALLVGPEGGFSLDERDRLRAMANVTTATLGATILRAETAAIFMLSVWRAWSDDEVIEA